MPYKDKAAKDVNRAQWYADHGGQWRVNRDGRLRAMYGITIDDYERMCRERDNCCDICGRPPRGKRNQAILHVDHDHITGRIRGLLCASCNSGIGHFGDNITALSAAIDYLTDREVMQGESL